MLSGKFINIPEYSFKTKIDLSTISIGWRVRTTPLPGMEMPTPCGGMMGWELIISVSNIYGFGWVFGNSKGYSTTGADIIDIPLYDSKEYDFRVYLNNPKPVPIIGRAYRDCENTLLKFLLALPDPDV